MNPAIASIIFCLGRRDPVSGVTQLLGTGFGMPNGMIATTAHVTGPSDTNLFVVIPKISHLSDYQDTTDTQLKLFPVELKYYDPVRDIAVLSSSGVTITSTSNLAESDAVAVGAPVQTLGYPHSDTGRLVLTEQSTSVGARILLGNHGIKTKHLVLNIQTRPGQSGSPVFNADGQIVAMIIGSYAPGGGSAISLGGVDPHTLHQTTHAISAKYISEIIQ